MLKNFVRKTSLRKKMRFYDKVITTPKDFGSGSCGKFSKCADC